MAAVGGVLTEFVGKVDPNDLFSQSLGLFENRNTSELGRLMQKGSITEKGYMTGMVIQQFGDIAKSYMKANELSIEARSRVQVMAMSLTKQALEQQREIQLRVADIAAEHQKLLEKITNNQSAVGQMIDNVNKRYFEGLMQAASIADEATRNRIIDGMNTGFERTTASLEKVVEAQVKVVETGKLDPAFFRECTQRNIELVTQVTQMTKELSKQDVDQLNQLGGVLVEGIRAWVTTKKQPEKDEDKNTTTPPAAGPSTPDGTPAITDQSGSSEGSTSSSSSSTSSSQ